MKKRKYNEYFHVYVLTSEEPGCLLKVGKANNLSRIPHLVRMKYAGRNDWVHVASFPVASNLDALALEILVHAKLSNQGYKVPRMPWVNRINKRKSYADECFSCSKEHAISVATDMAHIVNNDIAISSASEECVPQ